CNTASSGAKPEIALTIPKRCNLLKRPVELQVHDPIHSLRRVKITSQSFKTEKMYW
ncbi:hypothetical protein Leryth_008612, partial [Lithospermum erythrorhizon]